MKKPSFSKREARNMKLLEKKLVQLLCKDGETVNVYAYKNMGVRISEISVSKKDIKRKTMSGYSFMRCDVEAFPVILACEDYILNADIKPYRPDGWESDIDERDDAEFRLKAALQI